MADCSAEFRTDFLRVLQSRRKVVKDALFVEHGKPIEHPLYQKDPPLFYKWAMETCPRKEIEGFQEKLVEENLYLYLTTWCVSCWVLVLIILIILCSCTCTKEPVGCVAI
ncbi:hypothetical protein FCM35_KLT09517 [Carex littledalei]|uniref:Uncharacterized protein n=1 Tax=Carex littledalei TaxID=544730 RepID=A0A833RTX5_9POAL|nr:hypothetical protein FCM35_KLT09517 [Carex littledalei]